MASIYQRKGSDVWYLSWYENGKTQKKSLKTTDINIANAAREAKEIWIEKGVDITKGRQTKKIPYSVLAQAYLDWHKDQYPDSTARIHQIFRTYIDRFFGHMDIADLKAEDINTYKKWRRNKDAMVKFGGRVPKDSTLDKEVKAIHAMLTFAVSTEKLLINPLSGKVQKKLYAVRIKDSKPVRWFTADELEAIYEADPEFAPYFRLIANTGIRAAEMYLIGWDAIRFNTITLISSSEQRTKSGKFRQIPLSPGAVKALNQIREKDLPDNLLFPRMDLKSWSRRFRKAVKRAGIPHGTFHDLRHTFCSHLAMQHRTPQTIKDLAGHAKIDTTMKYIHLHPSHLAQGVEDLNL